MIPYLPEGELAPFPPTHTALTDPDGLLCAGGDLQPNRLIQAYQHGIFPWFSEGEPILWWSPSQRTVIPCNRIHVSRSMKRFLNKTPFEMRKNTDFSAVIRGCAAPRIQQSETWILPEMIEAYEALHTLGYAHSIECWQNEELVGGVYGIKVNGVFCGESMFSRVSNASKTALIHIASMPEYHTIDCQMPNAHLQSLGAINIHRGAFETLLSQPEGATCSLV